MKVLHAEHTSESRQPVLGHETLVSANLPVQSWEEVVVPLISVSNMLGQHVITIFTRLHQEDARLMSESRLDETPDKV